MLPVIKKVYLLFVSICAWFPAYAQNNFKATIEFPESLDKTLIFLSCDNGKESMHFPVTSNTLKIAGELHATFASIEILYSLENEVAPLTATFFITTKPATIKLQLNKSSKTPFLISTMENAQDGRMMGETELKNFIRKEEDDFFNYNHYVMSNLGNSDSTLRDSLIITLFEKGKQLTEKKAEFVRENTSLYYSFWLFRKVLSKSSYLNVDSLRKTYAHFPPEFRSGTEGKEVERILNGRNLTRGSAAPLFLSKDAMGKTIALRDLRGSYVLIDFWASWCGPCIKDIPTIERIRKLYPVDRLKIISVSKDDSVVAFQKAVEKYLMNWTHILNDKDLIKMYGAETFIPMTYLIDNNGVIIYNRSEEQDVDQLQKLTEILKAKL